SVNRALRCRERRLIPGRRSRSFQERDYWTCPQFGGGPASAPVGPVHALKLSAMYDGGFCTPQEKRSPRRPPLANVGSVAVMLAPPTSCRLRLEPPTVAFRRKGTLTVGFGTGVWARTVSTPFTTFEIRSTAAPPTQR